MSAREALLLDQVDTPILRAAVRSRVIGNRLSLAKPLGRKSRGVDFVRDEPGNYGLRALLGERLILRGVALIVSVAFDAYL